MAKSSNLTLPLVGAAGLGLAYLLFRKKTPAAGDGLEGGVGGVGPGRSRFPQRGRGLASKINHPLCSKTSGLTDADEAVIQRLVDTRVPSVPSWETILEARESAFDITIGIIKSICPTGSLPKARSTLDNYLAKSPELEHIWNTVHTKVWNKLTQAID